MNPSGMSQVTEGAELIQMVQYATAVAHNIFNSCNTQPVKVLFFNMIIYLKYNTIIMSI